MRRVLVTGGGAGIGRAIAHACAQNGDAVTIAGRTLAPLQETAAGYDMAVRLADVTVEAQVSALFDAPFDVVIANAGGGGAGKLAQTSLDAWNDVIAVNLTSTFLTFRAALQNLPQGAALIAIASTASLQGNASVPAYAAAKQPALAAVAKDLLSRLEARFASEESAHRVAGWSYINLADASAALRSFTAAQKALKPEEKPGIDLMRGIALAQWLTQNRDEAIATYKQLIDTGRAAEEPEDWADPQTINAKGWPEAEAKPLEAMRQATLAKFPQLAPP
jgi:NADP-dependent 3-hydroxy acid dehydrogenase YdfG